jgi:hypothetical protein
MINDIKDLEKLFKLCRKQGVNEFKMNGVEIKFVDLPTKVDSELQPDFQGEEETQEFNQMIENWSVPQPKRWDTEEGQAEIDKKVGLRKQAKQ